MKDHETHYVSATGHDLFLPFYDLMVRLSMREKTLRRKLLAQADIGRNHHVLDLGCGTGAMAILIRRHRPESMVAGVDGDPKILDIARRKASKASLSIKFDEALADNLPYPDANFDRVLCSFVLHHLTHDGKVGALREARRVLKPGGWFHLADFGPPIGGYAALVTRLLGRGERLRENIEGRLPQLMAKAGFREIMEKGYLNTIFGTVVFLSSRVDGEESAASRQGAEADFKKRCG